MRPGRGPARAAPVQPALELIFIFVVSIVHGAKPAFAIVIDDPDPGEATIGAAAAARLLR